MTTAANRKPTAEHRTAITRKIDAPRAQVFRAWTDPRQMARWWGPHHFTNPVCELEVRPGGRIHIDMRAPDGTVFPMTGAFREIAEPERLVFTATANSHEGQPHLESLTTVTFTDEAGGTRLSVTAQAVGLSAAAPQMLAGMDAGWTQSLEKLDGLFASSGTTDPKDCAMQAEPQKEHAWLQKLVGEWNAEMECIMGPGQPPMKSTGTESVRSIGGLWILGEGSGQMPGGGTMTSIITLGYDPRKQRFVGSFLASMMTHLWLYEGTLDASGTVLTLDTEGPSMADDGGMAKYQDIITFKSDDHRILTSQMLGDDGKWNSFVTAHYRRKA